MNLSARPGDDFFDYVNGAWIKAHPIPANKTRYDSFIEVRDKTEADLRDLIEDVAKNTSADQGTVEQRIGEFYRMGMDVDRIERQGIEPLQGEFELINNISNVSDLQSVSARMLEQGLDPFFYLYADADSKNSRVMLASLFQGGLGLPDRDYYIRQDNESAKTREEYVQHVTKMFVLLGDPEDVASRNAQTVMRMETRMANASFTRVENRDPEKTYNKMTMKELEGFAPGVDWRALTSELGYPGIDEFNVMNPSFFKELSSMMGDEKIRDWKTFLRWKLISSSAPYLSSKFENESFDFNSRILNGQEEMDPRSKRVIRTVSAALGEDIGRLYVKEHFAPESKSRMVDLVANLKKAFLVRIHNLDWMESSTKIKALEKLDLMEVKVGYPDRWRDYSGLEIKNDSYVMNVLRASTFELNHGNYGLDWAGKPVDRTQWYIDPQTVNAISDFNRNTITFPAAILQPPFFNKDADDAVNYGAIGMVIGHEMTHGFDDQGRKYDKFGNMTDWWSKNDEDEFTKRAQMVREEYDRFEVLPGLFVNGNLTLGEDIADFGGLTMAYQAYRMSLESEPEKIDGFTGDQRFFLGFAQIWRGTLRDEYLRTMVLTNEHPPNKFRVIGAAFNMPEFYQAFPDIKPGDTLYRPEDERPVIW